MPDQDRIPLGHGVPFAWFENVDNLPAHRIVRSPDGRVIFVAATVERITDVVPIDARKGIGRPAKIARVSIAWPLAVARCRQQRPLRVFDAILVVRHVDGTVHDIDVGRLRMPGALHGFAEDRIGFRPPGHVVEIPRRYSGVVGPPASRICRDAVTYIKPDAAFPGIVIGRKIEGEATGKSRHLSHID